MHTDELRFYAQTTIEETIRKAERLYGRTFPMPAVSFEIGGNTVAGKANSKLNLVKLNENLFRANTEAFIKRTIPHEVAHLICFQLHGVLRRGRRRSSHGPEWQKIMLDLGAPLSRCHSYSAVVPRKRRVVQRHHYHCGCPNGLDVTSVLHNRIQKGRKYRCLKCKRVLQSGRLGFYGHQMFTVPV